MVRIILRRRRGRVGGRIKLKYTHSSPNLKYHQTAHERYPTELTAKLTQVNFLLKITLDSSAQQPMLILENVKKVTVGRRMREGCLVRILREVLQQSFSVVIMESRNWGPNNNTMARATSEGVPSLGPLSVVKARQNPLATKQDPDEKNAKIN